MVQSSLREFASHGFSSAIAAAILKAPYMLYGVTEHLKKYTAKIKFNDLISLNRQFFCASNRKARNLNWNFQHNTKSGKYVPVQIVHTWPSWADALTNSSPSH